MPHTLPEVNMPRLEASTRYTTAQPRICTSDDPRTTPVGLTKCSALYSVLFSLLED